MPAQVPAAAAQVPLAGGAAWRAESRPAGGPCRRRLVAELPGGPDAVGCSGGAGRSSSSFWMFHHSTHRGGLPPPPRVHFEYPNGSPILNAKYARKKYGRSAQSGRMMCPSWSSPRPRWLNRKLRFWSRSTSCSAGHDSDASSGASKSFSIHAEYKFSVARFQVLRTGQTLALRRARPRRPVAAHGDFARDGAAFGRRAVARERRAPRPRGRRRDLDEPEIRRPAVPLTRCGRDASVGRDQRKLALERLLRGEDDAQRRALPRRDRRGQDRELGRVFAGTLCLEARC